VFIVFEGIDGAGKTTQAGLLHRRLRRLGRPALLVHEPGSTPLGETVRDWVKTDPGLTSSAELFLFAAARSQLVEQVIRPGLEDGVTVIADRFAASTIAYQGHGRGLDLGFVEQVNRQASGGLTPSITVLLDLDPSVGILRRLAEARTQGDNFDSAPLDFLRRVRQGYWDQAEADPTRWLVMDGSTTKGRVSREIWAKIQPLLHEEGLR
jgi:dTMP kinase